MSLFKKFNDESKTQAMELLNSSVVNAEEKKKLYSSLFHYSKLSDASNEFKASATIATNEKVALSVSKVLDQVSEQCIVIDKLEHFITLHIPKIEDGGNFGVGVQLDLVKKLGEMKESANKSMEALLGYETARADAIGKLNPPSSSKTVTKSTSGTTTDGTKEEKSSETTEEKSSTPGPACESRVAAVVAVDTLYYSKARGILGEIIISFVAVMDFIDKNKDKLVEPKGTSGGSNFSMY
mmetsp:Transcript_14291/g.16324  ORF Transcript_14291/g.16324 Transcript_14291/m.16324 type:complete len:239 (+) Transcript_14291:52-768(+)